MSHARLLSCAAILLLAAGSALASSVLGLSIEDQARLSKMVVTGEVVSQQGVVHPDNGLETEVTLAVTEVFKGSVSPGDVVVFHTRSGELDGERSEAVGEAVLQVGQEVLVFIEEVDGRLYNLGLSMGVWNVQEGAAGSTFFTRAVQDGLEVVGDVAIEFGPVSITDMARRIDRAVLQPGFDHPMLREQQQPRGRR